MSEPITYADLFAVTDQMAKDMVCVACGEPATWYEIHDTGRVKNYCDSCVGKSRASSVHRLSVRWLD